MIKGKTLSRIIAGCVNQDEFSQMELYRHFYSYGMATCLRYTRSRETALEMLNDGFLKVFVKINQFEKDKDFKPWLRKIFINAAIDHYRKYEKPLKKEDPYSKPIIEKVSYNEALDKLEFEDLLRILQQLTPAYRMVFNLYIVEGFSHAEIASQLGISEGTSKSNLFKARAKIKELLKSSSGFHIKFQ